MSEVDAGLDVLVPPNSQLAEQSVIGSLLIDNSAWLNVQGLIQEADFYSRSHQLIFRAIRRLSGDSKPFDLITVSDLLQSHNVLEDCGGLSYLGMLARDTISSANVSSYAAIVRDRSVRRQLIKLSNQLTQAAFSSADQTADDLIQLAETSVFKLRQQQMKGQGGLIKLKEALKGTLDTIEQNYENPPSSGVLGITSGFADLDELTSGFSEGLYVVAGRPAMGKTSLAMNFAESAALSGRPVAVFSLEMPLQQLAQRLLAGSAGLPLRLMRESWSFADQDWPKLSAGLQRIADLPMWIDDDGLQTVSDIRAQCMRLNAEIVREYSQGIGMIVIDYLQLLGSDLERNATQNDKISQISRALKLLSKEFGVPVIVLSQLNREVEKRTNKRPMNSDLRDSGAIEQDADVIMFVYRDEVYNEDSPDKGIAEVILGKQRNGPLGTVRLFFDRHLTRFRNYEVNHEL